MPPGGARGPDGGARADDAVEKRVYDLLNRPNVPYGNPSRPEELARRDGRRHIEGERNTAFKGLTGQWWLRRICESVRPRRVCVTARAGWPRSTVNVARNATGSNRPLGERVRLPREVAPVLVAAQ